MRIWPVFLLLVVHCGGEARAPLVTAAPASAAPAPVPTFLPPAPPTPGHLAINHRGLPCIIRDDGQVACDLFGRPAELVDPGDSPPQRLSRSEEWICLHGAEEARCHRGEERVTFAGHALVTAGGRTVCSLLGDRLTCLGAGTDRAQERLEHSFSSPLELEAAAVDDGVLCMLSRARRLTCLALEDPVRVTLALDATTLTSLDVGGGRVCGLDEVGRPHCASVDGGVPLQPIAGAPACQALAVGTHHACALSALGHVACWRHPRPREGTTTLPAPYIVDLPLHDVVALDADGPFSASLDARRGLHRWRIGPDDGQLMEVHPEPLMGLDNPAPPDTPECAGCRWTTQLGEGRCVKDPDDSGVVTTYATCAMRCCWVPPGWSE